MPGDLFKNYPISLFDLFKIDTLKVARDKHGATMNQTIVVDPKASDTLRSYVQGTVLSAQIASQKWLAVE